MIRAVLFDWGNTLVEWRFDESLFVEGHVRGLEAIGIATVAQPAFTAAYRERLLPALVAEREDEVDYAAEIGSLLAGLGARVGPVGIARFLDAEQRAWRPAHTVEPAMLVVLDEVRSRGLRTGLVSNLFDPPASVRELLAELGLLERLDTVVLSGEVGKRKPHPAMFEAALSRLGVAASETVMVGDRLREDVGGARALGLTTLQACWYGQDASGAADPDGLLLRPSDLLPWLEAGSRTT